MMAGQSNLWRGLGRIDDWMAQRNAEVRRLGMQAEALGREAWALSTRTGRNLAAARPSDVVAIGARILADREAKARQASKPVQRIVLTPKRPTGASNPVATATQQLVREAVPQVLAAARGAQDAFTFGLGDRAYAGIRAAQDVGRGENFFSAFHDRMDVERDRDRRDAERYGIARNVGQVVGTGAQVALMGPVEGLVAGGARIAQAAPLIGREIAAIGGAGAASGVGGQVAADISRGELGTVGDYAGAGIGGAIGGLAAIRGQAGYAGAAAGATTAVSQDLLNGRLPQIDKARDAALAGGALGAAGGAIGRKWSNSLTNKEKAILGEDLSRLRTRARGDETIPGPKTRQPLQGGKYTYPDQRTLLGELVESKFGLYARLSPRQREANLQLPKYRVDHGLPRDIGVIIGHPMAAFGYGSALEEPWDQ